jgi:hypothetical protein
MHIFFKIYKLKTFNIEKPELKPLNAKLNNDIF